MEPLELSPISQPPMPVVLSETWTELWAVLSPALKVMVALPGLTAVTTPLKTVAMLVSEEVQTKSALLGFTVAVRVVDSPTFKDTEVLSRESVETEIACC